MTEKLTMHTKDLVQENVERIGELFPNCLTEMINTDGKTVLAIDFEALKRQLSDDLVPDGQERYVFTWPGKSASQHLANISTNLTLRPCRENSVNFDNTENIYIEGDNLDALKLLRETYLGKIGVIYIDPPYNTGNDFVYNDNFSQTEDEFTDQNGSYDEYGNRLFVNLESNGRYHTNWLNMIYPRLVLAKDLLAEDAAIFISIDDNEQANMKKICDEIFGSKNFVSQSIRRTINSGKHDATTIAPFHEYLLIYAKNLDSLKLAKKPKDESERDRLYKFEDEYVRERGRYYITQLNKNSLQYSDALNYPIIGPDGIEIWPGGGFEDKVWIWRWSKPKVQWGIDNGFIIFKKVGEKYKIYTKSYEFVDGDGNKIERDNPYSSLEFIDKDYANFNATPELSKVFDGKKVFDFPKSLKFIKEILKMSNCRNGIVLDFFSGSATTAHAVMELNKEEKINNKFIMIQLPEVLADNTVAYREGYRTICDVGIDRIRRVGLSLSGGSQKTLDVETEKTDYGFRVLKVDTSNMNEVYYNPKSLKKDILDYAADNIKSDRSGEDLLFQTMLELGIELSVSIERIQIVGKDVFIVDNGYLVACFDDNVTDEIVTEIAKKKPAYVVFRDSSMANDSVAINFEQIFKAYSPNTKTRVL